MKLFLPAASALILLGAFSTQSMADVAASPLRSAIKASAKSEGVGMRCRRLQRAAQMIIANEGFRSTRVSSTQRSVRRPRKMIGNVVGYAVKRKAVGRGCLRCIARQFRRQVPLAEQLACGTHDICAEGDALKRTTSACVTAVCNGAESCCRRKWDTKCVTAASETCGDPCIPCSHDPCASGAALDPTCSDCVAQICASDPFCCDTSWSDDCVAKIETVCTSRCASPPPSSSLPSPSTTEIKPTETTITGSDTTVPDGSTTPDGTVPEGSTVPGGGGGSTVPPGSTVPDGATIPDGTLPAGSTLPPPSPTTVVESPATTVEPGGAEDNCTNVIDFEDAPAGTKVSTIETSQGQPVAIKATNPKLGGAVNAAVLYDSSCSTGTCSGHDTDLGTPNQDFGGPGIGDGGKSGSPTQNDESLGNLLIVATNLTDGNNDGLVDVPNDQKNTTTTRELDFSAFAPVSVLGLKLVDAGDTEKQTKIELFGMNGNTIVSVNAPPAEGNGLVKLDLPANEGVWKLIVTMYGSGGIDDIRLSCPGTVTTTTLIGPTTTAPVPTTTVPVPTTTVPVPTTTLPAPTTTVPIPTTTVPVPTTTLPAPTTTVPIPTTTVPVPTTTLPAPTTTIIGPTTTVPLPTTTVPIPTTTVPVPTTTVPIPTTTVPVPTTTLPAPTTTIGGGECPTTAELTIFAGTANPCSNNSDCTAPATCSGGRCETTTDLDTGYTGFAHNADLTDQVFAKADIECPSGGPQCGQCGVQGINPEPGNCRCSNDKRLKCDQPFAADADHCGPSPTATCDCYVGPPLSLAASGTPACVVNRLAADVTGTSNIDTGEGQLTIKLKSVVFLGENLFVPCPVCGGKCTAGLADTQTCFFNADCDTFQGAGDGTCGNFDPTPADGNRGGTCYLGQNNGLACDVDNFNYSFPAPGPATGGGHSLDCFPSTGKNVSGAGLSVNLNQTTGTQILDSDVPCGLGSGTGDCQCGQCSLDPTKACSSDAECGASGTCGATAGAAVPNTCDDGTCKPLSAGNEIDGECNTGPDDHFCDLIVEANGKGLLSCLNNTDCAAENIGVNGGNCTIATRRKCFLPTIKAVGSPDPETPIGVAVFCIPRTSNGAINAAGGLPGPGRVVTQGAVAYQCTNGAYQAGVGCPP